jgi:hypothetical protein
MSVPQRTRHDGNDHTLWQVLTLRRLLYLRGINFYEAFYVPVLVCLFGDFAVFFQLTRAAPGFLV